MKGFLDSVVRATGLSPVIAIPVVRRSCEMAGLDADALAPRELEDLLPPLRKGMAMFLTNAEVQTSMRRLEGLMPKPVEEAAPAPA